MGLTKHQRNLIRGFRDQGYTIRRIMELMECTEKQVEYAIHGSQYYTRTGRILGRCVRCKAKAYLPDSGVCAACSVKGSQEYRRLEPADWQDHTGLPIR